MPNELFHCDQCDCSFEVQLDTPGDLDSEPEVAHCPYCGEALEPDEL